MLNTIIEAASAVALPVTVFYLCCAGYLSYKQKKWFDVAIIAFIMLCAGLWGWFG